MRSRRVAPLLLAAAILTVLAEAGPAPASGVCTWGGTPDAQSGVFTVSPALGYVPSLTPLDFTATGPLAGSDATCAGTMTFTGVLAAGASCRFFTNSGTVSGVAGWESYSDAGGAVSAGVVNDAAGNPVAAFSALVIVTPALIEMCASGTLTTGAFSAVADVL